MGISPGTACRIDLVPLQVDTPSFMQCTRVWSNEPKQIVVQENEVLVLR